MKLENYSGITFYIQTVILEISVRWHSYLLNYDRGSIKGKERKEGKVMMVFIFLLLFHVQHYTSLGYVEYSRQLSPFWITNTVISTFFYYAYVFFFPSTLFAIESTPPCSYSKEEMSKNIIFFLFHFSRFFLLLLTEGNFLVGDMKLTINIILSRLYKC